MRSTSQLERFFRQARTLFTGGPVSAVTADLALAEMCFEHNVRWVCNYRTLIVLHFRFAVRTRMAATSTTPTLFG